MNVVNLIGRLRHPPVRDIISGFEGVARPGEMLREILLLIQKSLADYR